MKVHLIDGTYELYRSFYGAPPATSPTGVEVGASRGLLRSLFALLREPETTHVAIAFDRVIESFRNDLFDGYKTGDGIDPKLWNQFELAERVAKAAGVVVWPMEEFEADDALATAAARFVEHADVEQVLLCSADKDLMQMVRGKKIVLLDRMRKQIIDEAAVVEKFGIAPTSIPDYLGLVGDAADGIPGIPRWGAKSTSTVLKAYPHIDDIPPAAIDWVVRVRGAATLATNLRTAREEAALYRKLAVLRTDVPLAESLEDLEWKGADRELLTAIGEELGDKNVLDRPPKFRT